MISLFALTAAAAGAFGATHGLDQRDVDVYFACLAKRNPAAARRAASGLDKTGFGLAVDVQCYNPHWLGRSIQINPYYGAGKLAQALLRSRSAKFDSTAAPIAKELTVPAFYDGKSSNLVAEQFRVTMDCAVRADLKSASDFVLSGNTSGAAQSLAAIRAAMQKCGGEVGGEAPVEAVGAAAAFSLYRLTSVTDDNHSGKN